MKRMICGILICLSLLSPLCQGARAASWGSAAEVVSTALSQLDYQEGERSYSLYGEWYGYPHGHWCDMFVSWCADQAGIPEAAFPRDAACTTHFHQFDQLGRYRISAARGGSYVPRQGDVIFFYDPERYPAANVLRHVGLVLCVENGFVFTVEGNTLTSRQDRIPEDGTEQAADPSLRPRDYVAVKRYPLTAAGIHGYGIPAYENRTPLACGGWADLGKYESLRDVFGTLAAEGILPETSTYTYSPRYGMTRGDFLNLLMELYGLTGWAEDTEPFPDVPFGCGYYDAAMAARSAGIVSGAEDGTFRPDAYISGGDAQAMISGTLAYLGLEDRQFSFSLGDSSYRGTPYTIRADLAAAAYALWEQLETPAKAERPVTVNGRKLAGPVLRIGEELYGPLASLQKQFPRLSAGEDGGEAAALPAPAACGDRVAPHQISLERGKEHGEVAAFWYRGELYVALAPTAELLHASLK